ncbi:MAG: DUF1178 family protein [Novosphingobium sp.]|nr:DUF1178 family protein [Novosphingobium sp.]
MIVFDLECRLGGHRFEGWFGSSSDFEDQQARGLLACPQCASADVVKAPMAPSIGRKGNQLPQTAEKSSPASVKSGPMPPEAEKLMRALAVMQAEALKSSRWVGENFAEDARAMHYGEREHESIHGQATANEARELLEEGIEIAPLPFPVAPPGKAN